MFSEITLLTAVAGLAVAHPASIDLGGGGSSNPPATNKSISVTSLGTLTLDSPGFASVLTQDDEVSLYVSAFKSFGADAVYRINDIATATSSIADLEAVTIGGDIVWPNDLTAAPSELFGTDGVVVGGGFLVPGKSDGGIFFSAAGKDSTSGDWIELISQDGWFYHRVLFADMDGDGVLDMVSCRAHQPTIGDAETMLVILKPKNAKKPTGTWVETEIGPGCDALFTVASLNGDAIPQVLAASYFTSEFNLFYSDAKTGFASADDVQTILLDGTIGAAFDVEFIDVNGDGTEDLLVTNHQGDGTGSVYAYEIPTDITDPTAYTRHVLAEDFPVTRRGTQQAAPGSAFGFYPTKKISTGPVYIAMAGDASELAYVLVPGSADWEYTTTTLHDCGGTVGKLAVADVDGDGSIEIYIPCYDDNTLAAYTFGA